MLSEKVLSPDDTVVEEPVNESFKISYTPTIDNKHAQHIPVKTQFFKSF
jgi:hypothetical protein